MTISLRGTATGLAAGTNTALSFTLPTGHSSNDLLLGFYGVKPETLTLASGTFLTDYTLIGAIQNRQAAGAVATGIDVGYVYAHMRYRVHDGSEANPSGATSAAPSPRMSGMIAFQSTFKSPEWNVAGTTAFDNTTNTGANNLSLVGQGPFDVEDGDWIVVLVVHKTDAATHTTPSLSLSGTGATISGLTERLTTNITTTGNDGAMYLYTAQVTGSNASTTPTFLASTTPSDAAAVFARIREPILTFAESWDSIQM